MINVLFLFLFFSVSFASSTVYQRYFTDTYLSLEAVRNHSTGLVPDSYTVNLTTLLDPTSPSNIGLDLLMQLEALDRPALQTTAKQNIHHVLKTLKQLPYHKSSGLFFNRYATDGKSVKDYYISAIDNLHLAFALWTLKKQHQNPIAGELFKRMKFSYLYDPATGFFHGGAHWSKVRWVLEEWKYDYLGSEGRSLYSLGWALNLIKDRNFLKKFTRNIKIEMAGPILRLWDGGAFQLLLPRLLMSEERYSKKFSAIFLAYGEHIMSAARRLKLPVPAAFSACQWSLTSYNGKAGSPELVSLLNQDLQDADLRSHWDEVFTPHAALLLAPLMPQKIESTMLAAEHLGSNLALYQTGLGWLDGFHVKGPYLGQTVPVFLALDQMMIALASAQTSSPSKGGRTLYRDLIIRARLQKFYGQLDQRMK